MAVHGLGADPEFTWTCKVPASAAAEVGKDPGTRVHLLRDLVKTDFPGASILSFGHNADWFIDAPTITAQQTAQNLLRCLKAYRSKYKDGVRLSLEVRIRDPLTGTSKLPQFSLSDTALAASLSRRLGRPLLYFDTKGLILNHRPFAKPRTMAMKIF